MNTLVCPHCKKEVEISEAIIHQLQQQVRAEEAEKRKIELEKARLEIQASTERKLKEKFEADSKKSQDELQKATNQLHSLKAEFEKKQKELEKKAMDEALKTVQDEQRLKLKEKDLQLEEIRKANEEIKKANEDLKRKLEQGSQQRQGEVLELDLEEKLKTTFPHDEFLPIPKGVEGGDVWQKVMYNGKNVGSILWETKRTKAWSNGWTTKLKDDSARISASEAIIVSTILPNGASAFDRKDGVWITTYEHALSICRYVRFLITTVATIKKSASQTEEEWGQIREYLMSDSFKHRMQAHFDGVKALRDSLEAEKRATLLRWKKQEGQIDKLDTNSINFYGELKAIVSNLPEVKEFSDVPLLDDNQKLEEKAFI